MATRTNRRTARPALRASALSLPKIHPAGWYEGGDLHGKPGTAIGGDGTVFHDTLGMGQPVEHRLAVEDVTLGIKVVILRRDTLCYECLSGHRWAEVQVQFLSIDGESTTKGIDDCDDALNVIAAGDEYSKPFALVPAFARLFALAAADAERRGWFVEPLGVVRSCPPNRTGGEHARAS